MSRESLLMGFDSSMLNVQFEITPISQELDETDAVMLPLLAVKTKLVVNSYISQLFLIILIPNDSVVVSLGGFVMLVNSKVTVEEETADNPLVVTV